MELPKIKILVIILTRLAEIAGLAVRNRQIAKTQPFQRMREDTSIIRLNLHLMTIIHLMNLVPMLGDKDRKNKFSQIISEPFTTYKESKINLRYIIMHMIF